MKKIRVWGVPVLMLAACAVCGWMAHRMWFQDPSWIAACLLAACVSLALLACGRLIGLCDEANWTPEEHKARQVEQTDERNIAIREKAGFSTWKWTRYMLLALAAVAIIRNDRLYIVLLLIAAELQNIFYAINLERWDKKM